MIFLKKYMIFSVYSVKMVILFPTNMKLPFCQKSKDYLLPKNTLKNGISGRTTVACFPMENPGNLIIGPKSDFTCKLYGWRYSTMKNLQYLVTFSPQELYLEVSLSDNIGQKQLPPEVFCNERRS